MPTQKISDRCKLNCYDTEISRTEELIARARELGEHLRNDHYRPQYHFMPPWAWMNDINGAIYWKGRYHIFYQYNPEGGYWKWMQWGHASSVNLVHWVHHPVALTPTLDGPDRGGCFSGGAFVNKEGVPTFIYHGVPEGTCIATSEDDLLIRWTKHPANPVIRVPNQGEPDYGKYVVFDPCGWVDGNTYFALIGNYVPGVTGDGTSLFKSLDLVHWEYAGPFYSSERQWTDADEDCAVPDFFPLGNKHMLLFCSHLQATQYYLGRLENDRFNPQIHARMSWPGGQLGGPRTLLDKRGRRIFFDWIRELRGGDRERAAGWSGVMTLPRILSLAEDGTMRIEPAPELETLRMNFYSRRDLRLAANAEIAVNDVQGDCLELAVEMEPVDCQECGVKVRCSSDGSEQTAVLFDASSKKLKVDINKSTLDRDIRYAYYRCPGYGRNDRTLSTFSRLSEEARFVEIQEAPFELAAGEPLKLRIFLDRSVLEVFANNRQCITQRIYPTRPDSLGVRLFSRGGRVNIKSLEMWRMAPAHD